MEVMRELHLFQLKQRGFTFLIDGRIETEKHSDHLLRQKKKKRYYLCLLAQVRSVQFSSHEMWNGCTTTLKQFLQHLGAVLRLIRLIGLWISTGMEILVMSLLACPHSKHPSIHSSDTLFHSIYFVKAKSFDQDVGGVCIFILLGSQHPTHRKERTEITCLLLLLKTKKFTAVDLSSISPVKFQHTSEVTKNAISK